jgi:4-amino-4-deoxy-L-arabinose transferase-like glycosyltransferase
MPKKEKIFLVVVFLLIFVTRFLVVINYHEEFTLDETTYDYMASTFVESGHFPPSAAYPPFYPLFLSFCYLLFGHNLLIVRIIQSLLSSFLGVLIYCIAKDLFNRNTAMISAILYTFYLSFIFLPRLLATENLYCFLLLLFIFYFLKYLNRPQKGFIFLSGLFFSLAVLTRPVLFLFFVLIVPALFLAKERSIHFFKQLLLFIFIFFLPISVWSLRNYALFHRPILFSTHVGRSLYASWNPYQGKIYGVWAYDEFDKSILTSTSDEVEQNKIFLHAALDSIKRNPSKIPRLLLLKVLYFWSIFDWEIIGYSVFNISYFFILPFSIFGMVQARVYFSKNWPVYLLIFYTLMMTLAFYGSPRFRIPVEPFLIMFAGFNLDRGYQRLADKDKYIMYISAWLITCFSLWLFADRFKFLLKTVLEKLSLW